MAIARGTQRTYLKERLDRINRAQDVYGWDRSDVKLAKPLAVIEAEKRMARDSTIIDRFEKKEKTATERLKQHKRKISEQCRRLIEFGDAKEALKALDKFETTKF